MRCRRLPQALSSSTFPNVAIWTIFPPTLLVASFALFVAPLTGFCTPIIVSMTYGFCDVIEDAHLL